MKKYPRRPGNVKEFDYLAWAIREKVSTENAKARLEQMAGRPFSVSQYTSKLILYGLHPGAVYTAQEVRFFYNKYTSLSKKDFVKQFNKKFKRTEPISEVNAQWKAKSLGIIDDDPTSYTRLELSSMLGFSVLVISRAVKELGLEKEKGNRTVRKRIKDEDVTKLEQYLINKYSPELPEPCYDTTEIVKLLGYASETGPIKLSEIPGIRRYTKLVPQEADQKRVIRKRRIFISKKQIDYMAKRMIEDEVLRCPVKKYVEEMQALGI